MFLKKVVVANSEATLEVIARRCKIWPPLHATENAEGVAFPSPTPLPGRVIENDSE